MERRWVILSRSLDDKLDMKLENLKPNNIIAVSPMQVHVTNAVDDMVRRVPGKWYGEGVIDDL